VTRRYARHVDRPGDGDQTASPADDRPAHEDGSHERDPDLVALEGLEAELAELEAELERVERSRGDAPGPDDG